MASIQKLNGKWRVQVALSGVRKSRVCDTKQEAEGWAALTEARIRSTNSLGFVSGRGSGVMLPKVPSAVLNAIADAPFSADEIIASSYPFASSGVYFLIKGGEVIYVGQSLDVLRRVNRHRHEGGRDFDAYSYIAAAPEELDSLEALYIKALMPRLNMSFGNIA